MFDYDYHGFYDFDHMVVVKLVMMIIIMFKLMTIILIMVTMMIINIIAMTNVITMLQCPPVAASAANIIYMLIITILPHLLLSICPS